MSGVVLYSPEEARRNTFSVTKFHTLLGAELHTPDYDGPADFVINRANDPAVARRFESQGVRVFNPAAFCALANDKDACYRFMATKGVEILPIDQTEPPMVVKPKDGHGGQGVRLSRCRHRTATWSIRRWQIPRGKTCGCGYWEAKSTPPACVAPPQTFAPIIAWGAALRSIPSLRQNGRR